MKQPKRGGPSARIRMLKRLRLILSVIALVLCGSIVFCAVSLKTHSGKQIPEETTQAPAETETVQTLPSTMPSETTPVPETSPQPQSDEEGENGEEAPEADPEFDPLQQDGQDGENGEETPQMGPEFDDPLYDEDQDGQNERPVPDPDPEFGNPRQPDGYAPEHDRGNPKRHDDPNVPQGPVGVGDQNVEQTQQLGQVPDREHAGAADIPDISESTAPAMEQAQTAAATESSAAAALPAETMLSEEKQEQEPEKSHFPALTVLIISAMLLALDLAGIAACTVEIGKLRRQAPRNTLRGEMVDSITHTVSNGGKRRAAAPAITVGQLHNIGARPYQEDSSGVANLDNGVFAVVADGMGGLSGGDKVSQKIVYTMLEYSSALRPGQMDGTLEQMLSSVNDVINQMLGPAGLKKSGSTLMAVLVRDYRFHWITVGDSHIYLYHEGSLVQLNQEHNRGQELLRQAIAGQLSFDEVRADPKKSGLTSYIGMGRLKYVDKSLYSIPLTQGDRILLMTDGVFNALPEETICSVLKQTPNVAEAARQLERAVINRACPHQDNFTAVILGF